MDSENYAERVRDLEELIHRLNKRHDIETRPDELFRLEELIAEKEKTLAALTVTSKASQTPPLDDPLRQRLLVALEPILAKKAPRRLLAGMLCNNHGDLDTCDSPRAAAEELLMLATGDDAPLMAAERITQVVLEEIGEDWPDKVEPFHALLDDLRKAQEADDHEDAGLLGAWLTKVVADHERLVPYFQQRTELDLLDRVYVQLELRRDRLEAMERLEHGKDESMLWLGQSMTIRDVLALDPADHQWITRRWIILGDPGAGKTTLLRHLAADMARSKPATLIPVFESLPRLMREREWFLDRLERLMKTCGASKGLASVLERAGQEGRLLLLLDGLDEVPREDRDDADDFLRQMSKRWPSTSIVVSSRPIGFRSPGKAFQELELQPLDGDRRREFLARWFGRADGSLDRDRAATAASQLEADPSLRELSSNPLYLTLMALLLEQNDSPATNRTQLYDQVFELLLEGKHRPEPKPIARKKSVRKALRFLAFDMTQDNRDAEPIADLENRLYKPEADKLRVDLERHGRWRHNIRLFLDDLAEQTGILGPHDGEDAGWKFWHRTFREALAAEALEAQYESGGQKKILEHAKSIAGDESRWAEAYALLTGRIDAPDELVKALVRENKALGLRAIATAQTLEDATIDEILELTAKWSERAKVYTQIPDLLGEAEPALALIDRLRRRTRNGNDLYHLDLAAELVARRWPEDARTAQELRGRLYDHIPAPPEGLFQWVETPLDGRVELWREIPAGQFLMGSPEGEGYGDERPQHEIVFESGFRLGAVQVTQAQYAAFDPAHSNGFKGANRPVERVTWFEAMAFCRWLGSHSATAGARLPTEEEWEYACRAGSTGRYWSGESEDGLGRVGWYKENSGNETHPVGEKPANPWGLYDVHGNVLEWTSSPWTEDFQGRELGLTMDPSSLGPINLTPEMAGSAGSSADPAKASGVGRVRRGGSCASAASWARSAFRGWDLPSGSFRVLGFRVLLPLPPRS